MSEFKKLLLQEYEDGNILFNTYEGLQRTKLSDFIEQQIDGILYDLNRDEMTVLTFADEPKWINDYAVCKVIRALKAKIDEQSDAGDNSESPSLMYKKELNKIKQLPQVQFSVSEQLSVLKGFANKLGLYDAADYLSTYSEK